MRIRSAGAWSLDSARCFFRWATAYCGIAALALGVIASSPALAIQNGDPVSSIGPFGTVVQVNSELAGTGTLIALPGVGYGVLTAAHVIGPNRFEEVILHLPGGSTTTVGGLAVMHPSYRNPAGSIGSALANAPYDVAIVLIDPFDPNLGTLPLGKFALSLGSSLDDGVRAIGIGGGGGMTSGMFDLAGGAPGALMVDPQFGFPLQLIVSGDSGGPWLNANNEIIALSSTSSMPNVSLPLLRGLALGPRLDSAGTSVYDFIHGSFINKPSGAWDYRDDDYFEGWSPSQWTLGREPSADDVVVVADDILPYLNLGTYDYDLIYALYDHNDVFSPKTYEIAGLALLGGDMHIGASLIDTFEGAGAGAGQGAEASAASQAPITTLKVGASGTYVGIGSHLFIGSIHEESLSGDFFPYSYYYDYAVRTSMLVTPTLDIAGTVTLSDRIEAGSIQVTGTLDVRAGGSIKADRISVKSGGELEMISYSANDVSVIEVDHLSIEGEMTLYQGIVNVGLVTTLGNANSPGSLTITNGGHLTTPGVALNPQSYISLDPTSGITIGDTTFTSPTGQVISGSHTGGIITDGQLAGEGRLLGDLTMWGGSITPWISPGNSPGVLQIDGNFVQEGGSLEFEIGGSSLGLYDRLVVTGNASLAGTLQLSWIDGFEPQPGDSFDVLDWTGTLSGTFGTVALPTLPSGLAWNTDELYVSGALQVTTTGFPSASAAGLPGDFNNDGIANAADYVLWRKHPSAHGNEQGYIDWRTNFGSLGSAPSLAESRGAVPEPASLTLLALAGVATLLGRMRARN